MGFSEGQESMVADSNNHNARLGWRIDCIQPEQRSVAAYLCSFLNKDLRFQMEFSIYKNTQSYYQD